MLLARPLAAVGASAWSRLVSCHRPGPACLSAAREGCACACRIFSSDEFALLANYHYLNLAIMPILYPILACLLCSSSSEYGCK